MKYTEEYRDPAAARCFVEKIHEITTRDWTLMEICGGQTHSIIKFGLDKILPEQVKLVHGPGCPVCVTAVEFIDRALQIAARPEVIFCSFGDMLRVPGTAQDLLSVKADGGDVRIVYSPMDALKIARENPDKEVVFFGVGFETTAPATAMTIYQAKQLQIENFSLLISHVLVPPAMEAILSAEDNLVQGFLAAGHVCSVMGFHEYGPIVDKYRVPIVVTGFEPLDILQGIYMCILQLEEGRSELENQYARAVSREGNLPAQEMIRRVFTVIDRQWRGIGGIAASGLGLSENYAGFDATTRFDVEHVTTEESSICISGEILRGIKKPIECPAFGTLCHPEKPLGAPMVSSEGACAAYYRYQRTSA